MKLSLVIPILNEEESIPLLRSHLDALSTDVFDIEIILIDDGSTDHTAAIVKEWILSNPRVVLLQLSRNFGHQAAITAGLKEATGDAVVILDADLQDPPELIFQLVEKWQEGFKVVLAERSSRQERGLRGFVIKSFYKIFEMLSDFPVRINSGVFGLMDRVVVDHLLALPEQNRFIPGLRTWIGFPTTHIVYERAARAKGTPKQSLRRLFKYGIDAIFSFSYKPLRFSLYGGIFISFVCFIYGSILFVQRIMNYNVVPGFTTVAVSVFFLSGVILISNGIIGEYLARIYDEVKKRPLYIAARKISRKSDNPQIITEEYTNIRPQ
jgi:glycosyltransferase involved in cell wall biosynthesis